MSDKMKFIIHQRKTYIYLLLSVLSFLSAFLVSIPDNPPGIMLNFTGSILFILAFTHHWQRSRTFAFLLIGSVLGLVLFAILHNILSAIGKGTFFESLGIFSFVLAVFICPSGIIIGLIGCIKYSLREEKTRNL